jgi:D-alanyl-lipoteichoic acid acyltransferase DltB (MBOAT superfamily)
VIVFLLSGLWHGASWAFVVWGGLHGFYRVFGMLTHPLREAAWQRKPLLYLTPFRPLLAVLLTFHMVLFAWIFFRAGTLENATLVLHRIMDFSSARTLPNFGLTRLNMIAIAFGLLVMEGCQLFRRFGSPTLDFENWPLRFQLVILAAGMIGILILGRFESTDFIYFQF